MKILLETNRLLVKAPKPDDLDNYVKLHMDEHVRSLMYTRAKDPAQVEEWLLASIKHYERYGFTVGCVFEKSTGDFIGRSGLVHVHPDEPDSDVEIDCYLFKPYWRQHYGTELLDAFFKWGFENLAIDKIVATVYQINVNSRFLAEKVGMQYTGLREYRGIDFMWYEKYR